ncbi:glycosyltransferase family 2 protein [Flavobacterium sp. CBA20B-1]|uniref:glycosyltransferase family 2 protein n=1 Tax=unclassified Flavobacterium TaxID=196869 RepID=UPI002224C16C|nr:MULTISPECIES: glycosyltransferase family 2 protein [unclassified Flavobacterium]WCM43019.1 glycosyltransferase family 2 protein [Flavobacterium sp. CBA20B-1]
MNNNKLTALIITLNEEKNIRDLLHNLDFADEIIVVDSFSTDQTLEIIKDFPEVKVYQHIFKDFSSQRNIALSYATTNWVLFIDADERISDNLKNEIQQTLRLSNIKRGYYLKRKFYFFNKPVHFSGLQSDKNLRLFQREHAQYHGIVHEKLNFNENVGVLKNHLIHYSYAHHEHFKEKVFYYNRLKAIEKIKKGAKNNTFLAVFHPIYTFLNRYFFRLGFLDGKKGFVICKVYAAGIKERYKEMKRLQKK